MNTKVYDVAVQLDASLQLLFRQCQLFSVKKEACKLSMLNFWSL